VTRQLERKGCHCFQGAPARVGRCLIGNQRRKQRQQLVCMLHHGLLSCVVSHICTLTTVFSNGTGEQHQDVALWVQFAAV
jgi:hypothetical protein